MKTRIQTAIEAPHEVGFLAYASLIITGLVLLSALIHPMNLHTPLAVLIK